MGLSSPVFPKRVPERAPYLHDAHPVGFDRIRYDSVRLDHQSQNIFHPFLPLETLIYLDFFKFIGGLSQTAVAASRQSLSLYTSF